MPLPPGLELVANNALDNLVALMDTHQDDYLNTNGRYYQGVTTPTVVPNGGATAPPDLNLRPTDQDEDWSVVLDLTPAPISRQVDIHHGPDGWGYTCRAYVGAGLDTYVKAIGIGAHSVSHDWMIIQPVQQ